MNNGPVITLKQLQGFFRAVDAHKKNASIDYLQKGAYMSIFNQADPTYQSHSVEIDLDRMQSIHMSKKFLVNAMSNFEKVGALKILKVENNVYTVDLTVY